jgi:hypothetical protein
MVNIVDTKNPEFPVLLVDSGKTYITGKKFEFERPCQFL